MLQPYMSGVQLIGQNKNGYIVVLVDGDGMIVCFAVSSPEEHQLTL